MHIKALSICRDLYMWHRSVCENTHNIEEKQCLKSAYVVIGAKQNSDLQMRERLKKNKRVVRWA